MSLILEALKKSEANRRLGETPDLATPFATRPQRRSPLPLLFALIVLASAGGWWLLRTPPAQDKGVGAALVDGTAKPAAGVTTATPIKPPAAPAAQARATQAPAVAATTPVPDQRVGGGFVALPKPWASTRAGAANPAAPSNAAHMNAAAAARRPDPAAVNSMMAAPQPAQTQAQAAVAPANAARTAAPSVVATGAGGKKPDAAAAATPVAPTNVAAPAAATFVASGSGQKKGEREPASASNAAQPAASSFVASGAGHKKAEPAAETAPAPAGAVVASGQGQRKTAPPAVANTATAALPPLSAPSYNELPFATRKDLPALKLSMHVYAAEPLQRFVVLNNSRLGEGDKQEDLSVREIRPDGVVLEFHGQRFFYPRDGF